jgi:hypothetical protein
MKNVLTYTALAIALCFAAPAAHAYNLTFKQKVFLAWIDAKAVIDACPQGKWSFNAKGLKQGSSQEIIPDLEDGRPIKIFAYFVYIATGKKMHTGEWSCDHLCDGDEAHNTGACYFLKPAD